MMNPPSAAGPVPTLADRRAAMHAILRAMYEESDAGSNNRTSSPGSAKPLNTSTALPVIGAAWTEQVHVHTVQVSGISVLRHNVRKELEYLTRVEEKLATRSDGTMAPETGADPAISSNAPFLENLWNCVQHYVLADPPVSDLTSYIPQVRCDEQSDAKTNNVPAPLKVDVVSHAGGRWVRLFTLKPSSLLQEFRLVEAEEADASSDDDEEAEDDLRNKDLGIDLGPCSNFAFDAAARRSSLMTTAIELRKAADKATSAASSKSSSCQIEIDLILTRLDWPASLPLIEGSSSEHMRNFTEDERYRLRLHAILEELSKIPGLNIGTCSSTSFLRNPPTTPLVHPSFAPKDTVQAGQYRRDLNLDLSALVALTSDIVHGQGIGPEGTIEQCRHLFHTTPPYKFPASGDKAKMPQSKMNVANGSHGRALAEQLWRECCESIEDGGDFLHGMVRSYPSSGENAIRAVLWVTRESANKFLDISELVAGPEEKRRALALFGRTEQGSLASEEASSAFWHGSKWSSDADLLKSIQLPVKIFGQDRCPDMQFEDPLSKDFAQDLSIVVQRGITAQEQDSALSNSTTLDSSQHSEKNGSVSISLGAVPTAHTLRSLLAGVQHGMTTLTTNYTSIRWVVRQWPTRSGETSISIPPSNPKDRSASSLPTLPRSLGLIGKYYINQNRSAELPRVQEAVVWCLHPRSFSEQMRLMSGASSATANASCDAIPPKVLNQMDSLSL